MNRVQCKFILTTLSNNSRHKILSLIENLFETEENENQMSIELSESDSL